MSSQQARLSSTRTRTGEDKRDLTENALLTHLNDEIVVDIPNIFAINFPGDLRANCA